MDRLGTQEKQWLTVNIFSSARMTCDIREMK
jgi:hypothetical protein